jgi:hypothetical protein
MWEAMNYAVDDLARRVTDFQMAEDAQGALLGAVGLLVAERHGLIHSEGFTDFALADTLRPLLWERIQAMAMNQGLHRLWTREQAPFWSHSGLAKADAALLEKLPPAWRALPPPWWTLKLKEDLDAVVSAEKQFALFVEAGKLETHRAFRPLRILKAILTVGSLLLLFLAVGALLYLMWHRRFRSF